MYITHYKIAMLTLFFCCLGVFFLLKRDINVPFEKKEDPGSSWQEKTLVIKDLWSSHHHLHIEMENSRVSCHKSFIENCPFFTLILENSQSNRSQKIQGYNGLFDYQKKEIQGTDGFFVPQGESRKNSLQAHMQEFFLSWKENQPVIRGNLCKIKTESVL